MDLEDTDGHGLQHQGREQHGMERRRADTQLSAALSYFNTDDYESRLYGYEYGLLYSFANPAFYGHGIRYALTARATLSRRVMIALKAATTDYFDRDHISSGLQQIDASSQTDIEMQLRIRL